MAKRYPEVKSFYPKNPHKYAGDVTNIKLRSSWEFKFAHYCDDNPSVIQWNSEDIIVPYWSTADEKMRNYHLDFTMVVKDKDGNSKTWMVEIKPYCQTIKPTKTGRKKEQTYLNECYTYQVNMDKWIHANQYAKDRGWSFLVITENELYNGKPQ